MNMKQDRDIAIQFDMARRKVLESGADLSKIKIVMKEGQKPSYITQRIKEGIKFNEN